MPATKLPLVYSTPEVCALAGVTYRQVDYWVRTGIVGPSVKDASGSGSHRRWSFQDVVKVTIIARLLTIGVGIGHIRVIDALDGLEFTDESGVLLVGKDTAMVVPVTQLGLALQEMGGGYALPLDGVLDDLIFGPDL